MNEENTLQAQTPSTPIGIVGGTNLANPTSPSSLELSVADLHGEIDQATHLLETLVGRLKPVLNETREGIDEKTNGAIKSFATPSSRMVQEATLKVSNLRKALNLLLSAIDI